MRRLLKAVYGIVNAARRRYHSVATDLRNMNPSWNPACGLSEMKTVSFMLCWRAVTLHLENTSLRALTICTNGESGSHECSNSVGHKSLKPTMNKHTGTWGCFEISFTEYVKEIPIITLPSHRRRDKKSKITPLELSQLRALNSQLLWLGMQCLPQLLAPLSLLMGQTPQATVDTIYEVNKLARKATAWARMDHPTRWHFARVTASLHCKLRVAAKPRIKHVFDILAFESIETGGKIFVCSRDSSSSRRR